MLTRYMHTQVTVMQADMAETQATLGDGNGDGGGGRSPERVDIGAIVPIVSSPVSSPECRDPVAAMARNSRAAAAGTWQTRPGAGSLHSHSHGSSSSSPAGDVCTPAQTGSGKGGAGVGGGTPATDGSGGTASSTWTSRSGGFSETGCTPRPGNVPDMQVCAWEWEWGDREGHAMQGGASSSMPC
jgi:hypothetical protein